MPEKTNYFNILMIVGFVLILCAVLYVAADIYEARQFCNSINGTFTTNLMQYNCNGKVIRKFSGTRLLSFDDFWEFDNFWQLNLTATANP